MMAIRMKNNETINDLNNYYKEEACTFVYRPPGNPNVKNATLGVKFAQRTMTLDEWYLFGGTRWSRFKFRMKHPIVHSKRGLRNVWRRIIRIFVKPKMIQPLARHPHDKSFMR